MKPIEKTPFFIETQKISDVSQDSRVEKSGITLIRTGSPYAVAPGRVVKPSDATPYRVYTPFYKAWCAHGWRAPAATPTKIVAVTPQESDRQHMAGRDRPVHAH